MVDMPEIDKNKCTGCGLCISACYCKALKLVNNTITVTETEKCGWCGQCESVCPEGAISCPFEIIVEEK